MLRYFRALDARKIDLLEDIQMSVANGKRKGNEVSRDEWEEIRIQNKMWDDFINGKHYRTDS